MLSAIESKTSGTGRCVKKRKVDNGDLVAALRLMSSDEIHQMIAAAGAAGLNLGDDAATSKKDVRPPSVHRGGEDDEHVQAGGVH